LNLLFVASVFNACNGLEEKPEDKDILAAELDDKDGDPREERAFKMWINSLGIDGVFVNSLYDDIRSGILLLKVLDRVEKGCINWSKVEKNPNNKFKAQSNCKYVV